MGGEGTFDGGECPTLMLLRSAPTGRLDANFSGLKGVMGRCSSSGWVA